MNLIQYVLEVEDMVLWLGFFKNFNMAENSEQYSETARTGEISVAEETALLGEDGTGDDGDADSPEITMQGLAKMMTSTMNENMAAVASFALLGSSLKRSRDESNSSSQTNKKQKTSNDPTILMTTSTQAMKAIIPHTAIQQNSEQLWRQKMKDHIDGRALEFAQSNCE